MPETSKLQPLEFVILYCIYQPVAKAGMYWLN